MAVMEMAPSDGLIMASRQVLDFYCQNGQWVCRTWPRKGPHAKSPGELASVQDFTAAAKMTGALGAGVQLAWRDQINGGYGVTWVDAFRAAVRGKGWVELSAG